jgi:uncharacterized protein YbjT (DUF2867 family)
MTWVVLGGSGVLGGAVIAAATGAGHEVVAVSRRAPAQLPAGARHVAADVTTGDGLAAALAGASVVIDGTNAMANARDVLVGGTERVLAAAQQAGVAHFVGISIVGIDTSPVVYYTIKVEQERVIERSPVPWSLVRATQFHDLVPRFVSGRFGIVAAPIGWSLQPVEVREVAAVLVAAGAAAPAGRLPDVGGPEIVPFGELARMWKRAANQPRLVVPVPVPGARGKFLRSGVMCCADRRGRTFGAWLEERYASPPPSPPRTS